MLLFGRKRHCEHGNSYLGKFYSVAAFLCKFLLVFLRTYVFLMQEASVKIFKSSRGIYIPTNGTINSSQADKSLCYDSTLVSMQSQLKNLRLQSIKHRLITLSLICGKRFGVCGGIWHKNLAPHGNWKYIVE